MKGGPGAGRGPSATANASWEQVTAFRLSRHHLIERAPLSSLASIPGDIGGAQAQLLSAGELSLWARVKGARLSDIDDAIWKDRTIVKAWCMRRTMFLVPAAELSLFVRGSAMRAEREIRWVTSKGVPQSKVEEVVARVLDALDEPTTTTDLAVKLTNSGRYKLRYKTGGVGWGNRKKVPWVDFGGLALPANYLLHLAAARGVFCSGPGLGNESTFVRADRWIPHWRDTPRATAERELVKRYLGAYGPSTPSDFAIWTGMTTVDARRVWSFVEPEMAQVEVEGRRASVLESDLDELMGVPATGPVVRLLPFFDSFLLGRRSHRDVVTAEDHTKVYRPQGWVSPVLLVDGRASGVWSHSRSGKSLKVQVNPFARLSSEVSALVRAEVEQLAQFFDCPEATVRIR